jgi:TPR repeat protein
MQATMEFKNSTEPPKTIGEKLGVTHILSGVYQQINNEIKVIVELVDSSTGKIIWSLPYTTTLADVGNLQASIAKEVIMKFEGSTTRVKTVRVNMKAFSEVSRGDEVMYRSQTNFLKAADHYKNAIRIDSAFFPAWAGLIRTLANYSFVIDRKDSTIKKELKSHLNYVSTHFEDSWERTEIIANYKYHVEGKFEEARELFLKVLEENPNAETANYLLGGIYKRTLKLPQAYKYLHKAIKLRNTPLHMQDWGHLFHLNGEYEKEEAAMLNAASRGANAAWYAIYDLKFLKNDLSHLPSKARQLTIRQIKYDSLKLARDFEGLLDAWRKTKADSVFNQDRLTAEMILCFYQLSQDDSVSFYAKQWHPSDQGSLLYRNAFLGEASGSNKVISELNYFKEDLAQQTLVQEFNIQLAVFAHKYPRATQLLKDLNNKYPGYGNYLFLNNPMYDRIKKEYAPFNNAIRNLKLPPKLSDLEIVKM